ncbi:tetratricopeptide repeat protein [Arcicella aquatica]|uniref:Tetratricopeptide repeat protein n=1 Tax=Arcicella aquatica TaxID=217141 RepID=A0ABU5QKL3_9BACT|nr:tetratricopeptide repeat protein [Arcicella aquatica]MEA5257384.1 tetratricopeptide repeat protein [Arcicella aquatica]
MWVKTDDFDKQLKKLQRVVQPALFRYVIIQYNHADIKKEIIQFLQANFSDRALLSIKIRETDYFQLLDKTDAIQEGFVVIEDYEYLINDEAFAMGFNQRRDRLSAKNIAYICLMPNDDKLLKKCRELIPDWWSFRSILLKFEVKFLSNTTENEAFKSLEISTLGGLDFAAKKDELDWLEEKILSLSDTEINLKLELLQKASHIAYYLQLIDKLFLFNESMSQLAEKIDLQRNSSLQFAKIQNSYGRYFKLKGDFSQARNKYKLALDLATKANNKYAIAEYQNNLALVLQNLGDYEGAKKLLEKAVISAEKTFGESHPNTAVGYSNLASVLQDLGDYEGAKGLLEKALISDEKNFGVSHPMTAVRYSSLATVLQDLGDYEGAKKLLEKAVISDEKNFGESHPTTASTKWNLAAVLIDLKLFDEALPLLEQAYTTFENLLGIEHRDTKNCKGWLDLLNKKILEVGT